MNMDWKGLLDNIVTWCTSAGIKIVIAIIICIIAFKIINSVVKKFSKLLIEKKGLDPTIVNTLGTFAKVLLKVVIVMCLLGFLGIDTGGFAALIASIGVAIGFALNGALGNVAGGLLILLTRPFKVGDFISAQGTDGVVEEIKVISTKVVTTDNKVVYLPNGALSSGAITNFSEKDIRRVDLEFSVGGNDPHKVEAILLDVAGAYENVLKDPAPFARMTDYGAGNGVKVTLRAWCKGEDYWGVRFDLLKKVNEAFDLNGITIPFNRINVKQID